MNPIRIFMIGWEYPPAITGGLGIACKGIASALAKRGHHVDFLVPKLHGNEEAPPGVSLVDIRSQLPFLTEADISSLALHEPEELIRALRFSVYGAGGMAPGKSAAEMGDEIADIVPAAQGYLLKGGYGDQIYQEIHRYAAFAAVLAKRLRFDVIHTHDWMTYPAGLAAAQVSGKPLVCHVHATEFDRSGEGVNQYIYDLERKAFHECDSIITVSNYTKSILIERYDVPAHKIHAVHNAVDFEVPESIIHDKLRKPRVFSDDKIVLFLGRMTFQKGPDYFVRAAKIVIDYIKSVRFVMVGTGDMYHRMIELAADLGIGKYFHYTGFLNKEQVKRIYEMSDLYIMPSVSEPFGISPLEAMSHGVPVIVSKQSGVSEVVANCVKVDFWNVEEMADKIIQLLLDSALTEQLRWEGYREAQRLTWDISVQKIEAIYGQVTSN